MVAKTMCFGATIETQKVKRKMQNHNFRLKNKLKTFEFWVVVFTFSFLLLNFMGCATIPKRETLPTYKIGGITYIPLISLCDLRNIEYQYDTFSRTASLSKGAHKIDLMVGQRLVLVDGSSRTLRYPVDIYQGAVVVPYQFRQKILDPLFKESLSPSQADLHLLEIQKVVIDPGHGGTDPGAIGRTGLKEKDINLDIAKRLSSLLKSDGIKVVMTRSTDIFIPLARRVDIANNSGADLFISIHTNANRVRSLRGFEVYYLTPDMINDARWAMEAVENISLNFDKSCFASQSPIVKAILWDMIHTYSRAQSIGLARAICQTIGQNLNTKILGIKGANFQVLKGASMPAILIEVGFLSNNDEERMLKNSYYRQQVTEAIAVGIDSYAQAERPLMEAARR